MAPPSNHAHNLFYNKKFQNQKFSFCNLMKIKIELKKEVSSRLLKALKMDKI